MKCLYTLSGGATKTRVIDSHFARPLTQKERHEHNRRYVIFCALESRPFNMAAGAAFRYFIGGFSPSYASQTIHPETVNKHLTELSTEINTAITAKLRARHDSVTKTVGAISCTIMTLFTKCYPPPAWHAYKQYRPGAENNNR